jgi:hypothetical protein
MHDRALFASEEIRRLLARNGLTELDAAFRLGEPLDVLHEGRGTRHANKRVVRMQLQGDDGPCVYIKRQWQRERVIPRLTDVRHRIAIQSDPIHEWKGLRVLQQAGFHVAEPLALFWRGWGFSRAAVVTRAVPPAISMADMLQTGELEKMEASRRDALIKAATEVVAKLHREKISWRSMKAKHFYPEELPNGEWRIWLIDCEGVYRWASRRDCRRQWRNYLEYFERRLPGIQQKFLAAYGAAA